VSGTVNPLAASADPAGAQAQQPTPNPLATGSLPAPTPQAGGSGVPPVGAVAAHFAQAGLTPQATVQGIARANYLTQELAKLSGNADVTRSDVVKATADAVGGRHIGAEEGIRFISSMPEKPEDLRPWLKDRFHAALVGAVALHAHAHAMVGNAPGAMPGPAQVGAGAPMPAGGAAMPAATLQGPVAQPGSGGLAAVPMAGRA
jgi:hypothetical protein